MHLSRNGIDIIIPVYNALEDLKLCMESLKKYTNLNLDRIILIDDHSSDMAVIPYLKSCIEDNIILMQNEKNLGFSATINKGISCSDKDVILLNTDTIVTQNWVEKIVTCAYSSDAIGTVTPFSNNATLCSVPNFCQDNTVPKGYTIDSFASLIERCSLKKYPRITVAVGFCMFIKRSVINDIGLFDEKTFGKGYGEENDFCNRAEQLGYKHVLCDDTYIYHSGTASFVNLDKLNLMRAHEKILNDRYPLQMEKNHLYCVKNPDQYLRDNIDLYIKLGNKKNILYVVHMDFENTIGGTQYHVEDLVENLRLKNNIFVITPHDSYLKLTIYLEKESVNLKYFFPNKSDYFEFSNKEQANIFENIFKAFKIDIVHVHHLINYSFDCIYCAEKLGIPVIFTAHDYYMICPTISLVNSDNEYCVSKNADELMCKKCLIEKLGYSGRIANAFLNKWRREAQKILDTCCLIIVPSLSVKEILNMFYENIADKIIVIEHGIKIESLKIDECKIKESEKIKCNLEYYPQKVRGNFLGWAYFEGIDSQKTETYIMLEDEKYHKRVYLCDKFERSDLAEVDMLYFHSGFLLENINVDLLGPLKMSLLIKNEGNYFKHSFSQMLIYHPQEEIKKGTLKIAFIGGLSKIKGADEIYKIIKRHKVDSVQWYILGEIGDSELLFHEQKNLINLGKYDRRNIVNILQEHEIDLVCILSICPETFCYTLSEAILAKIPVIVTDIGALGERVKRDNLGWLVSIDNLQEDFGELIEYLYTHPEEIELKKEFLKNYKLVTVEEMVNSYEKIYGNMPKLDIDNNFNTEMTFKAFESANNNIFETTENANELVRQVENLEMELSEIKHSISYKIVLKMKKIQFPYKQKVKRILYLIYDKFFRS